jgi:hypothetical protein
MLFYHPAFDIYHCIFRMLRLLQHVPQTPIETERARILDFYLLFPQELRTFTFPSEVKGLKRKLALKENPYQQINDPKRIFFRLEPYQTCALRTLAAHELINGRALADGRVLRTEKPLPTGLEAAMKAARELSPTLVEFISGPLLKLDLYGKSGLKNRSDLFEYRYDFANPSTGA